MLEKLTIQGLPTGTCSEKNIQSARRKMDYGQRLQQLYDFHHHLDTVSHEIEEKNVYPVFYSNHNHHINIAGMREVVENLSCRPHDMYVAVAYSLLNGGQDKKIVSSANGLVPLLEEENIHMVPIALKKDLWKIKKSVSKSEGAEAAREAMRDAMVVGERNMNYLQQTLHEDAGLIVFPASTTEEAVKEKGIRPGMKKVKSPFLGEMHQKAKEIGRDILWVPIGMRDTNRIAEPRTSKLHKRALYEVGKEVLGMQLGIDLGQINPISTIKVGEPFYIENDSVDSNALNDFLMFQVAALLPREVRGEYGIDETSVAELTKDKFHVLKPEKT